MEQVRHTYLFMVLHFVIILIIVLMTCWRKCFSYGIFRLGGRFIQVMQPSKKNPSSRALFPFSFDVTGQV